MAIREEVRVWVEEMTTKLRRLLYGEGGLPAGGTKFVYVEDQAAEAGDAFTQALLSQVLEQQAQQAAAGTLGSRKKLLKYLVVFLVVLLLGAVVRSGAAHRTLPPAEGMRLNGDFPASSPSARLRVAFFNIHGCRDSDGRFDVQRTAEALRGFDLIGLSEVHGGWEWQRPDQAELLGQRLHMPWLFAPTEWRWWREDFGNGLLCQLPVTHWRRVPLKGTRYKGHRNWVQAEVLYGSTTIYLIVTHLDRVQDRASQLKRVTDEFLALPEPALLIGDLNTASDDPALARLLATPGVRDLVGETVSRDSSRRIDWILARGLRGVRGGIVDTGASDHPLVWAEVEESRSADVPRRANRGRAAIPSRR